MMPITLQNQTGDPGIGLQMSRCKPVRHGWP